MTACQAVPVSRAFVCYRKGRAVTISRVPCDSLDHGKHPLWEGNPGLTLTPSAYSGNVFGVEPKKLVGRATENRGCEPLGEQAAGEFDSIPIENGKMVVTARVQKKKPFLCGYKSNMSITFT